MPKLEKWSIRQPPPDPYLAPESQPRPHLHGIVYGHHRKEDGTEVTTSELLKIVDGKVLTRSGTIYELGEVDEAYEAAFPNARERFFSQESM